MTDPRYRAPVQPLGLEQGVDIFPDFDAAYTVKAVKTSPSLGPLTLHYPTREHALAAAAVIQMHGSIVTVTGPDGLPIAIESADRQC